MNLETFQISSAVVHDIPAGGDKEAVPILTDAPIDLDDALSGYFRKKIVKSLGMRGVEVVAAVEGSPVVREAVAGILDDDSRLVASSKLVAEHLHAVQTGRNSAGLLALALGTLENEPCISILKLEREEGLRFKIETAEDGTNSVDLELLRELTLTEKTKVFKTSLFRLDDPRQPMTLAGLVSDDQRGRDDGVGVANFYLSTFLGCDLKASPEKATYDFAQAAEKFFNESVPSPEKRGRYQVALLSSLQDNTLDLCPNQFAREHLELTDRTAFAQTMAEAQIDAAATFQKDVSLVRIRGFRMTFDSGMVLVGSRDDLEERIEIREEEDEGREVVINDAVKSLKGH